MDKYQGPAQFKPLSAWKYFWLDVLFSIPVVGFVFLIVFTFSRGNINRRSFARSYWCKAILALIICGVLALIGALTGSFETIGEGLAGVYEALPF